MKLIKKEKLDNLRSMIFFILHLWFWCTWLDHCK